MPTELGPLADRGMGVPMRLTQLKAASGGCSGEQGPDQK